MTLSLLKRKGENGDSLLVPSVFSDLFDVNRFFGNEPSWIDVTKRIPSVNIRETNKEFLIEMASPGMKREDFKVNVENHVLSISSEKEEEKVQENEQFTKKEFSYNSFSRSFTLPDYVKSQDIIAKYENGILKLSVPKKETSISNPKKEIVVN